MTRHKPLFAPIVLCALSTAANAQHNSLALQKGEGPAGQVHYDMASGKITKLVRPRQAAGLDHATSVSRARSARAATNSFNNTIETGYFTTVPIGVEFVDWAAKDTSRDLVTAVRFAYGTYSFDPGYCGGDGANIDLSFYAGTSGGSGICQLGLELERLSFTGLPGATSSLQGSVLPYYTVTAFLAQPFSVPDGQIGWGYVTHDKNGTGASNSGPRKTDFGTNTGWSDAFMQYADPASLSTCKGTFWFGGCSTGSVPPAGTGGAPCASFYLGLTEYVPLQSASCASRNAGNPADLSVANPPQIGGSFSATTVLPVAAYAFTQSPLSGVQLSGLINGTLLCDPTVIFGGTQLTTTGAIDLPVPPDPGLEGTALCFQAAEFIGPGNFQLTNAFDCVIGG